MTRIKSCKSGRKITSNGYSKYLFRNYMKPALHPLLSLICFFSIAPPVLADGAGSLDKSFGEGGLVVSAVPINGVAYGVGIQTGGRIVAMGSRHEPYDGTPNPCSIRLLPDGTLDLSFGTQGEAASNLSSFPREGGRGPTLALPDGGFLTGGDFNNRYTVERYQADGKPDTSFGSRALATGSAPCDVRLGDLYPTMTHAIALQPPWDRLVVLVRPPMGNSSFSVGRLHTNGALDTSFGTSGWFTGFVGTEKTGDSEKMTVLPKDGTVIIGRATTTASSPAGRKLVIVRLSRDGVRSTALDKEVYAFGTLNASLTKLIPVPDGKILACGKVNGDFFVMRLLPTGDRDLQFGLSGIATVRVGLNSSANDLVLQSNGQILITGKVKGDDSSLSDIVLVRLQANGAPDGIFGHGGKVILRRPSTADSGNAVAVQDDGKILVAGQCGKQLAVLRLNSSGIPDYETWATASGLAPEKQKHDASPSGDGTTNLMKFAFNLDASRPDVHRMAPGTGTSGLPSVRMIDAPGGRTFRIEYLQRRNSGLIYVPLVSQSLRPGSFSARSGVRTVLPVDEGWDRVIVEMPVESSVERLFGVVNIIEP